MTLRTPNLRRTAGAAAGALLVAGALAACGSSDSSAASDDADGAASSATAAATADVTQRLADQTFSGTLDPIADISKVTGKRVLFAAISLKLPYFQAVLSSMKSAADEVGVSVDGCDGNFTPSNIAGCVTQAISQHYDAIILDNIPVELIGNGADALKGAGVQVIAAEGEMLPPAGGFTYAGTGGPESIQTAANWVIDDSRGKAHVLVVEQNDTPQQKKYVDDYVMPTFTKNCPGCKVEISQITQAQLGNLGTQVSTALLKDPSIDYVLSEFDANVQYIIQGLQTSPRGKDVKLVGAIGDLASLQRIQSGQYQVADVAVAPDYAAWAVTDQTLRVLAGAQPWTTLTPPYRLFDKTNIADVTVSEDAINDGSLFGGDTWSAAFKKAWGVS